jgi:hypothetical protein
MKYNTEEARQLKTYGELPEHAKINETGMFGEGDDEEGVLFDDYGDDQDIEIEDDVSDTIEPHPRIQEIDIPSYVFLLFRSCSDTTYY